jgi:hypothetical protein
MVVSAWIALVCVQFLGEKKRFHTAWTPSGHWLDRNPAMQRLLRAMI